MGCDLKGEESSGMKSPVAPVGLSALPQSRTPPTSAQNSQACQVTPSYSEELQVYRQRALLRKGCT